ncbi:MAG: toll/interleukin-1 receptor domain-containing protein [Bacteroidales bacterium]|nr:toll/interleukin-1 receptor domain-containing protein [Bacteroidales bacterium]
MVSETEKDTKIECVNKGRPVYFSYARNSNRNPEWTHISDCVDVLLKEFDNNNIEYRVDKRDIGAGDKISDFEREIGGKSEIVVLVFSDKYFRSLHCMYEFVQIKKSLAVNPSKRLFCIKSGDFNLADVRYILELERYWGDIRQEYEEIEYHRLRNHSGTEIAAFENGFYMDDVRNLYSFFSAINYSYATNEDWSGFINDIKKYYTTSAVQQPLQPKPQPQIEERQQSVVQTFSQPIQQQQFQTQVVEPVKTPLMKKVLYGVIGIVLFCIMLSWFGSADDSYSSYDTIDESDDGAYSAYSDYSAKSSVSASKSDTPTQVTQKFCDALKKRDFNAMAMCWGLYSASDIEDFKKELATWDTEGLSEMKFSAYGEKIAAGGETATVKVKMTAFGQSCGEFTCSLVKTDDGWVVSDLIE